MEQHVKGGGSPPASTEAGAEPCQLRVAIVGVCGSGKSLLAAALRRLGYRAYAVAQEHSQVGGLFRHLDPDVVIYLEAADHTVVRRKQAEYGHEQLKVQRERLTLAREKAHIRISTDDFTPVELLSVAREALEIRF